MATYFAATNIHSNSGASYPVTLKVRVNNQAMIQELEVLESELSVALRPWQCLDVLAEIMPKFIYPHPDLFDVYLSTNPVKYPSCDYSGHPCLAVQNKHSGAEKRYRLNHCVGDNWMISIPPAHLRAMVYWWRLNRDQYATPICEWSVWRNEA